MMVGNIKIVSLFHKTLDTRETSSLLFKYILDTFPNCSKIELDFSGVEFMSRSFADQFHKELMTFSADNNVQVVIKNADYQITEILNAVSRTQTKRTSPIANYQIYSFNDIKAMENYMFAW